MKKLLFVILTLSIVLSALVGCSSGPDLTVVNERFDEVTVLFNETTKLFNENGWSADEDILATHNATAAILEEIKTTITDPDQAKNIDVDTMIVNLEAMIPQLKEYKAAVSVPYPFSMDLTALAEKYNEIAELHTRVLAEAEVNGWLENETLLASLNSVADTMEVCLEILENPDMLENKDIVQADIDEYTVLLDAFVPALTDALELVAVPAE